MATLREEDGLDVSETTSEVGNVTAMLALSEQVKFVVSDTQVSAFAGCEQWNVATTILGGLCIWQPSCLRALPLCFISCVEMRVVGVFAIVSLLVRLLYFEISSVLRHRIHWFHRTYLSGPGVPTRSSCLSRCLAQAAS